MIKKLYWISRILAYLTCLAGIFYYLACLNRPGGIPQPGLYFVYAGFLLFFLSYALHFWIRFGRRRPPAQNSPP